MTLKTKFKIRELNLILLIFVLCSHIALSQEQPSIIWSNPVKNCMFKLWHTFQYIGKDVTSPTNYMFLIKNRYIEIYDDNLQLQLTKEIEVEMKDIKFALRSNDTIYLLASKSSNSKLKVYLEYIDNSTKEIISSKERLLGEFTSKNVGGYNKDEGLYLKISEDSTKFLLVTSYKKSSVKYFDIKMYNSSFTLLWQSHVKFYESSAKRIILNNDGSIYWADFNESDRKRPLLISVRNNGQDIKETELELENKLIAYPVLNLTNDKIIYSILYSTEKGIFSSNTNADGLYMCKIDYNNLEKIESLKVSFEKAIDNLIINKILFLNNSYYFCSEICKNFNGANMMPPQVKYDTYIFKISDKGLIEKTIIIPKYQYLDTFSADFFCSYIVSIINDNIYIVTNVSPENIDNKSGKFVIGATAIPQINKIDKDCNVTYLKLNVKNNTIIDYPFLVNFYNNIDPTKLILYGISGWSKNAIGIINLDK